MKIGCVIILYNPEIELLFKTLDNILPQVHSIFIGDNTTIPNIGLSEKVESYSKLITYSHFGGNIGIASAQNKGIKLYIQEKFDYILFLDQDSLPPIGMVGKLLNATNKLVKNGLNVGGIGPRAYNYREGEVYLGRVKKGRKINENITEVSEIISSGSFIAVENFIEIGFMEDELFIDGVDHEWCWRANKNGDYNFYIIEDLLLDHQLGEGDKFFVFRKVAIPTPFRTYYQFRNYFKLVKRKYVPFYWKCSNGIKYIIKYFYYPIALSSGKEYFKKINKGIFDGLFNK